MNSWTSSNWADYKKYHEQRFQEQFGHNIQDWRKLDLSVVDEFQKLTKGEFEKILVNDS